MDYGRQTRHCIPPAVDILGVQIHLPLNGPLPGPDIFLALAKEELSPRSFGMGKVVVLGVNAYIMKKNHGCGVGGHLRLCLDCKEH